MIARGVDRSARSLVLAVFVAVMRRSSLWREWIMLQGESRGASRRRSSAISTLRPIAAYAEGPDGLVSRRGRSSRFSGRDGKRGSAIAGFDFATARSIRLALRGPPTSFVSRADRLSRGRNRRRRDLAADSVGVTGRRLHAARAQVRLPGRRPRQGSSHQRRRRRPSVSGRGQSVCSCRARRSRSSTRSSKATA